MRRLILNYFAFLKRSISLVKVQKEKKIHYISECKYQSILDSIQRIIRNKYCITEKCNNIPIIIFMEYTHGFLIFIGFSVQLHKAPRGVLLRRSQTGLKYVAKDNYILN